MKPLRKTLYLDEPQLLFEYGQRAEDPRDGLFLFGPVQDASSPKHLRVGVVGTSSGIERYSRWVRQISGYLRAEKANARNSKSFPGFQAAFRCNWPTVPSCTIELNAHDIEEALPLSDRYQAIYRTVGIFADAIETHLREEDSQVDFWFVVIPDDVHRLGRPNSRPRPDERIEVETALTARIGRKLLVQPSLFQDWNEAAMIYKYELDFHNQLKARLLKHRAVTQIVRESTLTPDEFIRDGRPFRNLQDPATVAWNLCTAAYFKAGGRPWKLAGVREGVCYIGLVFKQDHTGILGANACCGAQMFLDSGDGLVFKGALGPWYSPETKQYHLSADEANRLISSVLVAYEREHDRLPNEVFIHGRTRFNKEEYEGFESAVPSSASVVCVRIGETRNLKLYPPGPLAVTRGTAYLQNRHHGYLFTRGFIPSLGTYPGREVPNPLDIAISAGEADLELAMRDIMSLTKVNFNTCIYADGKPVTLRFADSVGEILTSAPVPQDLPPLPFRHYI